MKCLMRKCSFSLSIYVLWSVLCGAILSASLVPTNSLWILIFSHSCFPFPLRWKGGRKVIIKSRRTIRTNARAFILQKAIEFWEIKLFMHECTALKSALFDQIAHCQRISLFPLHSLLFEPANVSKCYHMNVIIDWIRGSYLFPPTKLHPIVLRKCVWRCMGVWVLCVVLIYLFLIIRLTRDTV